jgi:hypothetical protein
VFLGCLFIMANYPVDGERNVRWSRDNHFSERVSFRLNDYITRNQFKEVMLHQQATAIVSGQVS